MAEATATCPEMVRRAARVADAQRQAWEVGPSGALHTAGTLLPKYRAVQND